MTTPLARWLHHPIPIEEIEDDTRYVLRAELPGVDPAKDITVMVADGEITLVVDRIERHRDRIHAEFRYGSFRRHVTMPRRAQDDTVRARYDDGVLEVTAELVRSAPIGRTVPVALARRFVDHEDNEMMRPYQ